MDEHGDSFCGDGHRRPAVGQQRLQGPPAVQPHAAYKIQRCEEKEFDALTIHSDTAPQEFQAEGHLYFVRYVVRG